MPINENEEQYFIVNTPKNLNLDLLFPTFNKNIEKVYWLINQINHFSSTESVGYTINIKNHNWLFSSANISGKIISTLVENKIIYQSKKYVVGKNGKAYKMVQPFKADNTSNQIFYKKNDSSIPKFLQRFLADDFTVQNAVSTKYKDTVSTISTQQGVIKSEVEELKNEIKKLKERNKMLEKELQDRIDIANAKVHQNRINNALGVMKLESDVITSPVEVNPLEVVKLTFTDESLVTLENCDDVFDFEEEVVPETINEEFNIEGLSINDMYYILEECGYECNSVEYNVSYTFDIFKIYKIQNVIKIEGDVNLVERLIKENAEAFIKRKNVA
ncbi:hypothetical protein [Pedobacter gandavensis]|uniref:hypothetical protein n=1 Tax=Pedobacter gandavensis TaxID=2679963 RepID=UPI002930544B|nr:hypothetical protein [Pedobacter gandavensis]